MAAKLILSMEGVVLHEYPLNKERITIGRKPHNDVVIDNLAVSGEHAVIVTILNDSFLEDMNSTNGVAVNGAVIKKHFLQSNDLIEIGKYKLKYINDQQGPQTPAEDFERTMVLRSPVKPQPGSSEADIKASLSRTTVNSAPLIPPSTPAAVAQNPQPAPAQAQAAPQPASAV